MSRRSDRSIDARLVLTRAGLDGALLEFTHDPKTTVREPSKFGTQMRID
jgi:hypothetical protein